MLRCILVLAILTGISLDLSGQEGGKKESVPPDPQLHELAFKLQTATGDERNILIEVFAKRNDLWAFDLLQRLFLAGDSDLQRRCPDAAIGLLLGHLSSRVSPTEAFSRAWLEQGSPTQLRLRRRIHELTAPTFNGLCWYVLPKEAESFIASQNKAKSDDTAAKQAALLQKLVEIRLILEKKEAGFLLKAANELCSLRSQEAPPPEFPLVIHQYFSLLCEFARAGKPEELLDATQYWAPIVLFCKAKHSDAARRQTYTLMESALIQVLKSRAGREAADKDDSQRARFLELVCCTSAVASPKAFHREDKECDALDLGKFSIPVKWYVAGLLGRDGREDAREFLAAEFKGVADAALAAKVKYYESRAQQLSKEERGKLEDEASVAFREVKRFMEFVNFQALDLVVIEKAIEPLCGSGLPDASSLASTFEYRKQLYSDVSAPTFQDVVAAYKNGKIRIGELLSEADNRGMLTSREIYDILKKDVPDPTVFSDTFRVLRILQANGGNDDEQVLQAYWGRSVRDDIREAVIAAVEARSVRPVGQKLAERYPDWRVGSRRLIAHMFSRVPCVTNEFLIEQLSTEKDGKCLEFIAEALLNACRSADGAKLLPVVRRLLVEEDYGQRWFYVAGIVRALRPEIDIQIDPLAAKPERNRQVDAAFETLSSKMGRDQGVAP